MVNNMDLNEIIDFVEKVKEVWMFLQSTRKSRTQSFIGVIFQIPVYNSFTSKQLACHLFKHNREDLIDAIITTCTV